MGYSGSKRRLTRDWKTLLFGKDERTLEWNLCGRLLCHRTQPSDPVHALTAAID